MPKFDPRKAKLFAKLSPSPLMPLKFSLLGSGTSQGVPLIGCSCAVCQSTDPRDQRLRSALLVESEKTRILIDAGPDLRQQLLRAGREDLDAVLITHQHQDHTAGLDELRAINFIQQHPVPVYCRPAVEARLRQQYAYIFENPDYPGIPQIPFVPLPHDPFQIGDITIEPVELVHGNLAVTGFRFGKLAYCTDVNYIAPAEKAKLRALRYLILGVLRPQKHHSHFCLAEGLALCDELGVEQAYFTHVSHQMGRYADCAGRLPAQRQLAYDGLQIIL